MFFQFDIDAGNVHAFLAVCGILKQTCSPNGQVVVFVDVAILCDSPDLPVVTASEMQLVIQTDQLESCFQQVVAIVAPTGYMQEKIQFGRCRTVANAVCGYFDFGNCHSSMTSLR